MNFREFLNRGFVILDGATGSNLQQAGMKSGDCPEQWIVEHPKTMIELQKKYSEIVLTLADFEPLNAVPSQTQGIVSQPTMIPGVEVSALIKEEPDKISVNLRSRNKIDVSAIAQKFGGGGHARAAGFKVTGKSVEEVTQALAQVVQDTLQANGH